MTAFETSLALTVRGNEVTYAGFVPLSNLSRYGEWARWSLFRAPDCALRGRFGAGVARAQILQYFAPITYPAELCITTTLSRVGRTSLELTHVLAHAESATIAARVRATLVQLGPEGPAPLDPSLAELVTPAAHAAPPPYASPEGDVFLTEILVRPSDMDQFGHVNQARYVDFADDVRYLAAAAGHPAGHEGRITGASVDYRREVRARTVLLATLGVRDGVRSLRLTERDTGIETTRIAFVG